MSRRLPCCAWPAVASWAGTSYGELHHGLYLDGEPSWRDTYRMPPRCGVRRRKLAQNSPIWAEPKRLEAIAREPSRGLGGALLRSLSLGSRTSVVRKTTARGARRFIDAECKRRNLTRRQRRDWNRVASTSRCVDFTTVAGTARLILFERLFAVAPSACADFCYYVAQCRGPHCRCALSY